MTNTLLPVIVILIWIDIGVWQITIDCKYTKINHLTKSILHLIKLQSMVICTWIVSYAVLSSIWFPLKAAHEIHKNSFSMKCINIELKFWVTCLHQCLKSIKDFFWGLIIDWFENSIINMILQYRTWNKR